MDVPEATPRAAPGAAAPAPVRRRWWWRWWWRWRPRRRIVAAGLLALSVVLLVAAFALRAGVPRWFAVQGRALVAGFHPFASAPIARAATPRALPSAPAALRWPAAVQGDAAAWLSDRGTVALIVLKDGAQVHESYHDGFERAQPAPTFSVAKAVVSALAGIAHGEGRLPDLDAPVTRWLPELRASDPRFEAITLRHLLLMRSGIAFDENHRSPWSDVLRWYLTRDLPARVRALQVAGPPDQRFSYASGDTQLLAMVLERAVGEPLARYAERRLWQPMGAEFDASWSLDSAASGQAKAFCCLNARAIDLARFGQLFVDGGRVDGRAVVPADWVRESTAAQQRPGANDIARGNVEKPFSGRRSHVAWQWRRTSRPDGTPGDAFYAQGLLGQYVYVDPAARIVVVRLGRHQGDVFWPGWIGELVARNR